MHQPVLVKEVIGSLNLRPGQIVLDATVGGGGHAEEILKKILPGGRLVGIDADASALATAEAALARFRDSFTLVNDNFRNLGKVLAKESAKALDAAIFDIGISSYQLDDVSRGFSVKGDARLDMRMDRRLDISAYDIVNGCREDELSEMIAQFGEERHYRRIAAAIISARTRRPIETTAELAGIIRSSVGRFYRKQRIDPATRTFQAIRIVVNDELGALEAGIKEAVTWLKPGGRICAISFHSLEDRIVKNLFKGYAALNVLKLITKKPMRPSREEVIDNVRSRSAKMRVAERI